MTHEKFDTIIARLTSVASMTELAGKLQFTGETAVLVGRDVVWALQKRIRKLPGALIYQR